MLILKSQFQKRLVYALLHVSLELVAPPELVAAELAGVAGRDAALVALVPDHSRLAEVAPPTPVTSELVGVVVAGRVGGHPGLPLHEVGVGQDGLVNFFGFFKCLMNSKIKVV